MDVHQAGPVNISSPIHLKNCLLIPNLSHKLLSISQLTKELDCTVLMTSTDCIVQDACTRMCWVYFLKHKTKVFDVFVKFYNMLGTQFQTQLKILRSDNGREYMNQKMHDFISTHGLIHQTSCPYTPQQNGVAERKNRTLLEITRALMFEAKTPAHFWPEVISTASYLTIIFPTKILQFKTPLETLRCYATIPPSHSLTPCVFGCIVYVHLSPHTRHKLEPCVVECVFLGYGVTQKGYRCFDPLHNKLYTTLDCDFFESSYYYPKSDSEHYDS